MGYRVLGSGFRVQGVGLGLYWDNGEENENYYIIYRGYIGILEKRTVATPQVSCQEGGHAYMLLRGLNMTEVLCGDAFYRRKQRCCSCNTVMTE